MINNKVTWFKYNLFSQTQVIHSYFELKLKPTIIKLIELELKLCINIIKSSSNQIMLNLIATLLLTTTILRNEEKIVSINVSVIFQKVMELSVIIQNHMFFLVNTSHISKGEYESS